MCRVCVTLSQPHGVALGAHLSLMGKGSEPVPERRGWADELAHLEGPPAEISLGLKFEKISVKHLTHFSKRKPV